MPSRFQQATFLIAIFLASLFTIRYILPTFAEPPTKTPKFGIFYPPTITPTPTATPTSTPTPSPLPTVTPNPTVAALLTQAPLPSPTPLRQLVYFSQRDPQWSQYGGYPNIVSCGCGSTTIAQILAGYLDRTGNPRTGPYSPPRAWDMITAAGAPTDAWCGIDIKYMIAVLQNNGISVNVYNVPSENKYLVEKEFKRWTEAGNYVIGLAQVNGIGHYFLITNIDDDGTVWVYDVYYGYRSPNQPTIIQNDRVYYYWYDYLVIPK